MSEKSGTGEGRGDFLREDLEGGREGGGKWERGFPVAFSSYRLWWRGGGGDMLCFLGIFFLMKIWKLLRDFHMRRRRITCRSATLGGT